MPQSRVAWFKQILQKYPRVAIIGGPRAGKTTLSRWSDRKTIHSDDYAPHGWSEASALLADSVNGAWETYKEPLVVEGVAAIRAIRKGMKVDAIVLLEGAIDELTPRQEGMRKGVMTVLEDVRKQQPDLPVLYAPPIAKEDDEEETEA